MVRSIEEIVGNISREPAPPGTSIESADEVRYVSFDQNSNPADSFDEIVWKIDPPLVSSGGVSLANWILNTPDRTQFYAVEYHDDVKGWQLQIEQGAEKCNALFC